jgi:type IV secretory pathway VirB10-like protein
MFIPHIKQLCLLMTVLLVSVSVQAKIYTWVDEDGQTHYAQQPPASGDAKEVDVPPPPPIDPVDAQQQVDELIEQQENAEKAQQEAAEKQAQAAERQQKIDQNCQIAQQNLRGYQNNPGRRIIDADGNVTRMSEEERQQKIAQTQEQIDLYCQ